MIIWRGRAHGSTQQERIQKSSFSTSRPGLRGQPCVRSDIYFSILFSLKYFFPLWFPHQTSFPLDLRILVSKSPVSRSRTAANLLFNLLGLSFLCLYCLPSCFPRGQFQEVEFTHLKTFPKIELGSGRSWTSPGRQPTKLGKPECLCVVNLSLLSEERKGLDVRKTMEADVPRLRPWATTYRPCDLGQVIL